MKLFYSDTFVLPLPAGHRFPMSKYSLLRESLETCGRFAGDTFHIPPAASDEQLARAHSPDYLRRVTQGLLSAHEQRRIGFPWTPQMVERSRRSSGATLAACRVALDEGCAANLAGGTHHAFADRGEGYCVFNDAAVAARTLEAEGRVRRVVIIDCDVHQGNGTASIFAGDPSIFTFSIHGAKNFPFRKERSDLDVEMPDGTGDDDYLRALEAALRIALDTANAELAIYLAGADPYEHDRFGRLKLTKSGLLARDRLVLEACATHGIPVAVAMAGGYAPDVRDTVEIHHNTILAAADVFGADGR